MKLDAADEFVRYLADTANEQYEKSYLHMEALGSSADDPDTLRERMLMTYGSSSLSEDTLPDLASFQESLKTLAEESGLWLDSLNHSSFEEPVDEPALASHGFMGTREQMLQSLLEDAISIQDRFVPEPHFARTGTGYLRSAGVAELQEAKKKAGR